MNLSFPIRIYIIALIFRLVPVFLTANLGIGLDDMFQYDMLARSLASGNGFRWYAEDDLQMLAQYVDFDLSTAKDYDPEYGLYTSFRAPLYPTFLAIVYFIFGQEFSRFFFARLAQAIFLGATLAPLTYLVAKQIFPLSSFGANDERGKKKEESVAQLSAWIVACYPMLLVYPLGLGTENPFFILLLCSFYFLLKSINSPSKINFLLAGIFLGLTALTRSVILPFAGLAILYVFARSVFSATKQSHVQSRGLLRFGLDTLRYSTSTRNDGMIMLIAFVLVITPWMIRNSLLHGKLTGIETSMGYNLYLGYHPLGNGSFVFGPSLDLLTIMDDSERDEIGTQKAIELIKHQPERFIPLALNRLGFFFGLEKRVLMYFYSNNLLGYIPQPILIAIAFILLFPFVLLTIFSVFGVLSLKWNHQTALLLLLITCYLLPHIFILSEDRFHLALIPYFAILASYGYFLISKRELNFKKWQIVISLALICLLLLNWGLELNRDAEKIAILFSPTGNTAGFPY
ncbi:MAG: glycosyltransferase family 39 protein [Anaerolineales bacterium]|nr:glycosyltransferase family 39 protein [Anaerolineales bacterium]